MERETIRFMAFVHEGWVKLSLQDGESISHRTGGPDEEGYSYHCTTWSREGDVIRVTYDSTSQDCDGRLDQSAEYSATEFDAELKPQWKRDSECQRDYSAEAAGY